MVTGVISLLLSGRILFCKNQPGSQNWWGLEIQKKPAIQSQPLLFWRVQIADS